MENEMTLIEVEETLEQVAAYEAQIKSAEQKRDALKTHYQNKILAAEKLFEDESAPARMEIALLTERLKRYAESNLSEGKKSIAFPSGRLAFRKQPTRFFFGDSEVNGKDERLIKFAKVEAPELVKASEYVDWSALKSKLTVDGENVYYAETGEVIEGLRAQAQPDKFTVKTN